MTCKPGHLEGEPIPEEEGEPIPAFIHWLKHHSKPALQRAALIAAVIVILTACAPILFTPTPTASPSQTEAPTETTQPGTTPAPQYCIVTTGAGIEGALNLRTGPGTSYPVIRILTEGETLIIITRGAWLEVMTEVSERGYINANYCEVKP